MPEVAAHVSVLLYAACGGGGITTRVYSCFYSWHAMCAAAGWYVELTERGFLQELRSNCVHMEARNATKELLCMQCELYKSSDTYKTKQWKQFREGDHLCKVCEDLVAAASVTHAATPGEHDAVGGQSAAGACACAAACDVGAGADDTASDKGAQSKQPHDGDSAAAGHA